MFYCFNFSYRKHSTDPGLRSSRIIRAKSHYAKSSHSATFPCRKLPSPRDYSQVDSPLPPTGLAQAHCRHSLPKTSIHNPKKKVWRKEVSTREVLSWLSACMCGGVARMSDTRRLPCVDRDAPKVLATVMCLSEEPHRAHVTMRGNRATAVRWPLPRAVWLATDAQLEAEAPVRK